MSAEVKKPFEVVITSKDAGSETEEKEAVPLRVYQAGEFVETSQLPREVLGSMNVGVRVSKHCEGPFVVGVPEPASIHFVFDGCGHMTAWPGTLLLASGEEKPAFLPEARGGGSGSGRVAKFVTHALLGFNHVQCPLCVSQGPSNTEIAERALAEKKSNRAKIVIFAVCAALAVVLWWYLATKRA